VIVPLTEDTSTVARSRRHAGKAFLRRDFERATPGTLEALAPPEPTGLCAIWRYDKSQMVNEVQTVVEELGGESTFGHPVHTEDELQDAIREGFPQSVVEELMRSADLTLRQLAAALDLPVRSLQRHRREGRLARHESDRLYRLARTVALAKRYIGDPEQAIRWLKRPNRVLGARVPIDLLDTEAGARRVEDLLGRIAYGGVS